MDEQRPPITDAEYRLVHGPWPRWVLQLGLMKLALHSAATVLLCIAAGAAFWLALKAA